MARPKKDDKVEESASAAPGTISVDEFRKTRDSVIQGLNGLQLAVGNLLNAYMAHCNSILGESSSEALQSHDLNRLTSTFVAGGPVEMLVVEGKKEKKKRAKKERDPDMPKRPLTAAFLYGQTARPLVKKDLEDHLAPGEKLGANAVNEEVTKRWNGMAEEDKQLWRNAYQENMVKYKQQMEEYAAKKGTTLAEMQIEGEVADVVAGAVGTDAEGTSEEDASEKEPSPPPKAPTPPPAGKNTKRRKNTKENGVSVPATQSPAPLAKGGASAAGTPAAKGDKKKRNAQEKDASPEEPRKKRPRKSKGGDDAEAVDPMPETEKKERKRKRKGEAA